MCLVQRRPTGKSKGYVFSTVGSLFNYVFGSMQSSLIWFRMLVVFFLLKTKQVNDVVLKQIQKKPAFTVLPQRLLIIAGAFLEYFIGRIRPDDRTLADLKKTKQQTRLSQQQQQQYFVNR
jgi:phage-related holin